MFKRILGVTVCFMLAVSLIGCSTKKDSEPDYADDEAMQIVATGWQKRSQIVDQVKSTDTNYLDKLKEGIQAEIDADSPLKDRQFKDSKMQEDVIAYLNSLDGQLNVLKSYSMSDPEYYEEWNKVYDQRSQLLKKFVENYGMKVDSKYQSALDDLLANGTAAQKKNDQKEALDSLVSNISWQTEENYGTYIYTAIVENTSDYSFKNVGLLLNLYDSEGIKTETYANATSWKKGDKIKFEAYGAEVNAERIETQVQFFDIDE